MAQYPGAVSRRSQMPAIRKCGLPPGDTPLGGVGLEIHGNQGDRGTAGCIVP